MGATASMDTASILTKEEAMAAAGELWDEAKWEAAEKDSEGKVKAEVFLAFAPAAAEAAAAEASVPTATPIVAKVQAALARMAAKEPELNACVEQLGDSALKLADKADRDAAESNGQWKPRPLEGVPILVKANIDLAGTLSTNATPALKDFRPASTATVVAKLLEAGAIPIAKTTLPEGAFGFWGWSQVHGLTKNPHNASVTAGGSSTGTAVGIAAGYATMGLGSDTEGSMRGPAAINGVVGFRPTLGRYPSDGIVPCNIAHDTAGPMSTTVAGVAIMDAVITGADPAAYAPASLSGVTVAVSSEFDEKLHASQAKALEKAVAALEAKGATVKRGASLADVRAGVEGFDEPSYRLQGFRDYCQGHGPEVMGGKTPEEILGESYYVNVKNFFLEPKGLKGPMVNVTDLEGDERAAVEAKNDEGMASWEAKYAAYFAEQGADVCLLPSLVGTPAPVQEDYSDFVPTLIRHMGAYGAYTNLNGLKVPSLVMPTPGVTIDDVEGGALPTGVVLFGKSGDDKALLEIGMALELALKPAA